LKIGPSSRRTLSDSAQGVVNDRYLRIPAGWSRREPDVATAALDASVGRITHKTHQRAHVELSTGLSGNFLLPCRVKLVEIGG
jgi:hypothetical protein